jgi:hypothetical protein
MQIAKCEMRPLGLALVLLSFSAVAGPLGPTTQLPGFDREQSRMVYEEGSRLFQEAIQKVGARVGVDRAKMSAKEVQCGVAQFMRAAIEAAAFQRGGLSASQVSGARRAIEHLQRVADEFCDRPKGGGLGTGNAGDKVAKAFFDEYAPQARTTLDTVRDRLASIFSPEGARAARDAVLAAVLVVAGAVTLPLWAS